MQIEVTSRPQHDLFAWVRTVIWFDGVYKRIQNNYFIFIPFHIIYADRLGHSILKHGTFYSPADC